MTPVEQKLRMPFEDPVPRGDPRRPKAAFPFAPCALCHLLCAFYPEHVEGQSLGAAKFSFFLNEDGSAFSLKFSLLDFIYVPLGRIIPP
jgi:hypothetical protein